MRWKIWIVMLACTAFLAGCAGEKDKKRSEKERPARASARIEEVRKRLDDLQHSLVQLYQETEIQQMKIRAAQENLAALRKSLGDLARTPAALERLTTTGISTIAAEIPRLKAEMPTELPKQEKKKKEHENRALETLLLLAFVAFLGTVGYKLYRKKKENDDLEKSDDTGTYTILKPPSAGASDPSDATADAAPEKVEPASHPPDQASDSGKAE